MLSVQDLKQTRFYQEVYAEGKQEGKQEGIQQGKQEAVSRMLELGWELETIAQCVDLPIEVIREQVNNN